MMHSRTMRTTILLMILVLVVGLTVNHLLSYRTKSVGKPSMAGIDLDNYPKVDGSTSTYPIGQMLFARAMGLDGELRNTGTSWAGLDVTFPMDARYETILKFRDMKDKFEHHGTHGAYMRLIGKGKNIDKNDPLTDSGDKVLILVARKPSPDEIEAAKKVGVELDIRPIAKDAFVFIANRDCPVKSLMLDQIKGIYTGKIKNWKEIGGPDMSIMAYSRDENSGSQQLMEDLVMKGEKMMQVSPSKTLMSMAGLIDSVANGRDSIAYSVYYYERYQDQNLRVKLLAVNGVRPSSKTIADGTYPLVSDVYAVTWKNLDKDSSVAKLRDWVLSNDGQRLIAKCGYVPIRKVK